MTETQDSPADAQLDERVDALVAEINRVSATISQAINDNSTDAETEAQDDETGEADEPSGSDEDENAASADAEPSLDEQMNDAGDEPLDDAEAMDDDPVAADESGLDLGIEPAGETSADDPASLDDRINTMLTDAAEGEPIAAVLDDDASVDLEPEAGAQTESESAQDAEPEMPTESAAESDPEPEPAAAASVEDLDAELAGLADELLEGDFDDVDDVLEAGNPEEPTFPPEEVPTFADGAAIEPAADENPTDEANEDLAASDEVSAPIANASAEDEPTSAADAQPASASEPDPVTGDTAAAADTTEAPQAVVAQPARPPVWQRLSAVVYETAIRTSKPLDGKPTYARDIVGWFAAVTLFNAVAVWAFWILGREPEPAPPSTDAVSIDVSADGMAEGGIDTADGSPTDQN